MRLIVNYLDTYNYNNSKLDEFEKSKYNNKIKGILTKGINDINFEENFLVTGTGVLGEYDFAKSYFPIKSWSFDVNWYFDSDGGLSKSFNIYTKDAINIGEFDASIRMNQDAANDFIKKRKKYDGTIDRNIYLKVSYSIINYN